VTYKADLERLKGPLAIRVSVAARTWELKLGAVVRIDPAEIVVEPACMVSVEFTLASGQALT
jgi:hypothetical protein